jgi:hypothetical protein
VLAAFRTLAQIKKQVIANSDEAAAAKMNAEAILLAERAYVKLSHEQKAWSSSTGRLDFVRLNDEITQVWFRTGSKIVAKRRVTLLVDTYGSSTTPRCTLTTMKR